MQRLLWLTVALCAWLLPAAAQQEASSKLYARATPAGVEVALQVKVSPTWHLYHTELGAADAIGTPTTVDLSGIGMTFGELVFPEPHTTTQEWGAKGVPTWTYTHGGTFAIYGFGAWDDGAPDDLDEEPLVFATIAGQTCSDLTGTCIQYEEELDVAGPGADALFANFPAALRPAAPAPSAQASAPKPFKTGNLGQLFGGADEHIETTAHHRIGEGTVEVVVHLDIDDDWHLFHTELGAPDAIGLPTSIALKAEGVTWDAPVLPEPHKLDMEWGKEGKPTWAWTHEGELDVVVRGTFTGAAPVDVRGTLTGQVCSDIDGTCIQVEQSFTSGLATSASVFANATDLLAQAASTETDAPGSDATAAPTRQAPAGGKAPSDSRSLWYWVLAGIGGGLFTLLMPCTYPMIPITVSFFTKQAEKSGKPPISLSIAYGLGIVLIFEAIALIVGPAIIPFAQHWITNLAIGLVFCYFALVLLGVVNLNPPAALMNLAGTATRKGGFVGVFLMGATLVVTSFTCTAPIMSTLLTAGAQDGSLVNVIVGMAAFGATMAIPFMVLSLMPGKLSELPSAGEWMNTIKVALGFVELAAAFKFFSNADVYLQKGLLPDELLLLAWIVILGIGGLYLLGQVKLTTSASDRISPMRALFGMLTVGLVGFLLMTLLGYPRGELMTAFLPGYSNGSLAIGAGSAAESEHPDGPITIGDAGQELHIDSYATARQSAIDQGKLLLINLTGFT